MACGMFEMKTAATKPRLIVSAGSDLDAEDHRFGDAVDDRAHDDPHRAARSRRAEALLHDLVGDQEHGDADHHPQPGLPRLDIVLGLGQ